MDKTRTLGPVIENQLPNIKLCESCQARFKSHMNSCLPPVPDNGNDPGPMHIPDFVLCNACWVRLMDEAGISKEEQIKIRQGAVTTH